VGASSSNGIVTLIAVFIVAGLSLMGYWFYRSRVGKTAAPGAPGAATPKGGRPDAAGSDAGDEETVFFSGPLDPDAAPPATLTIVKSPGMEPGEAFDIQGAASIGRHQRNDVRLVDKSVSRKHAEIYFDRGSYFLRDLGSRYGTVVNRHRISLDATALFDGAEITLGPRSTLQFALQHVAGPDDETLANFPGVAGENDDTFKVDR
jgi:hypothetical protein